MNNLLAWKRHESVDFIVEMKMIAGIRVKGVTGIYMTETDAYSYMYLFHWNPDYMG